jgi:hypothetical protein
VQPPLGFRRLHLIEVGSEGVDAEFISMLVRAVEERIGRTLEWPANHGSVPVSPAPQSPVAECLALLPRKDYTAVAMSNECVWLGHGDGIEVWDFEDQALIGTGTTRAYMLFATPSGDACICFHVQWGYQSPDTVYVNQWGFANSLDDARVRNREARDYEPGEWEYKDGIIERARRGAIRHEDRIFHTFSWSLGPVALSEDGRQAAVVTDDHENQIEVWGISPGEQPQEVIPLGNRHPDELLFLRGGAELVAVKRPRKDESSSCIYVWNIASRELVAEHEIEWVTVNSVSRAHRDDQIVLGLDQSVAFLNVNEGSIDARVEIQSRPVRSCRFDPQSRRVGVLTDKELIVIDSVKLHQEERFSHSYTKGVCCDLRGDRMAALVLKEDENGHREPNEMALVFWKLVL